MGVCPVSVWLIETEVGRFTTLVSVVSTPVRGGAHSRVHTPTHTMHEWLIHPLPLSLSHFQQIASSKDAVRKKLIGIATELQATDFDEVDFDEVLSKVSSGK